MYWFKKSAFRCGHWVHHSKNNSEPWLCIGPAAMYVWLCDETWQWANKLDQNVKYPCWTFEKGKKVSIRLWIYLFDRQIIDCTFWSQLALIVFGRNGCGWSLGKMSLADSRVICERPTWVLINKKGTPKMEP